MLSLDPQARWAPMQEREVCGRSLAWKLFPTSKLMVDGYAGLDQFCGEKLFWNPSVSRGHRISTGLRGETEDGSIAISTTWNPLAPPCPLYHINTPRRPDLYKRYHPLYSRAMAANHLYNTQLHQHLNPIPIAPHPQQPQDAQMPHFGSQQPFAQSPLPQQSATVPRKRPKYSRSKMGCLSCRVRKVKVRQTVAICKSPMLLLPLLTPLTFSATRQDPYAPGVHTVSVNAPGLLKYPRARSNSSKTLSTRNPPRTLLPGQDPQRRQVFTQPQAQLQTRIGYQTRAQVRSGT